MVVSVNSVNLWKSAGFREDVCNFGGQIKFTLNVRSLALLYSYSFGNIRHRFHRYVRRFHVRSQALFTSFFFRFTAINWLNKKNTALCSKQLPLSLTISKTRITSVDFCKSDGQKLRHVARAHNFRDCSCLWITCLFLINSQVHDRYFRVTNPYDYVLMSIRYFPVVTEYFEYRRRVAHWHSGRKDYNNSAN